LDQLEEEAEGEEEEGEGVESACLVLGRVGRRRRGTTTMMMNGGREDM